MAGPFKMKGSPMQRNFGSPMKETEAEFLAKMKKEGMTIKPEVNVKMSEHQTNRDNLARKAGYGRSGNVKKGMEQSVRSMNYAAADKFIESQKNKRVAKSKN